MRFRVTAGTTSSRAPRVASAQIRLASWRGWNIRFCTPECTWRARTAIEHTRPARLLGSADVTVTGCTTTCTSAAAQNRTSHGSVGSQARGVHAR